MARRTKSQNEAPAGRRPFKKTGIVPPRSMRTTAAYKWYNDQALRALARGAIDTNTAYAIQNLAMSGAEMVMSIGLQRRTKEGIIVLTDEEIAAVGDAAEDYDDPKEIEGEATEVVEHEPETPSAGTKKNQAAVGAQVVALIAPPRPANDSKTPPDDAEEGGD